MRMRDFVNAVEELGVVVEFGAVCNQPLSMLLWHASEDGMKESCIYVSGKERFALDLHEAFYDLDEELQEKLFALATEYASTKIEERSPQKKYYIEMKDVKGINRFINFDSYTEEVFIFDKKTKAFQTKFTKDEIEAFGLLKYANSPLFKLVEVK